MRLIVVSTLVALAVVHAVAAQRPITPPETPIPERTSRNRTTEYAIVVKGCIQGKRLKMSQSELRDLPFDTLRASEFILEGPKELMQQLQERHDKHYDEIQGIAIVPPPPNDTQTTVQTKKIGRLQVGVGTREESGAALLDAPRPVRLTVASVTHFSEACAPRQ